LSLLAVPLSSTPSPTSETTALDDSGFPGFEAGSVSLSWGGGSTIKEREEVWLNLLFLSQ